MSLYQLVKRVIGVPDEPPAQRVMAQLTILSTPRVKRSSETRPSRARG